MSVASEQTWIKLIGNEAAQTDDKVLGPKQVSKLITALKKVNLREGQASTVRMEIGAGRNTEYITFKLKLNEDIRYEGRSFYLTPNALGKIIAEVEKAQNLLKGGLSFAVQLAARTQDTDRVIARKGTHSWKEGR